MQEHKLSYRLTYYALFVLALCTFISFSATALSHIFMIIPGFYFMMKALQENELDISRSAWCLLGLIVVGILSVIFNQIDNPIKNILKLKYFILGFVSIFAFQYTFKNYMTARKIRILINVAIVATTIATISGLIGLKTGFNPLRFKEACHETRACGMYGMYMTYGYGIGFVMTLLTGLLFNYQKLRAYVIPWILIPCWIINLVGLILSYARGGWIGFVISLPFIFWYKGKRVFFSIIAVSLMGAGLAYTFIPKVKSTFTNKARLQSNNIRLSMFKAAVYAVKEKPLLGYGYRNFEPNSVDIKARYDLPHKNFAGHAHNNFFEHLATTGILGFMILVFFHLFWFWEELSTKSRLSVLTLPFVVNLFVSGQFQYTFGDGENMFLIMSVYALSQLKWNKDDS